MRRSEREALERRRQRNGAPDRFAAALAGLIDGAADGNGRLLAPEETLEAWDVARQREQQRHRQTAEVMRGAVDLSGQGPRPKSDEPRPPAPPRPTVQERLARRRLPPEVAPPQDGDAASWRVSIQKGDDRTDWLVDGEPYLCLYRPRKPEGPPPGIKEGAPEHWAKVPWRLGYFDRDGEVRHLAAYPTRAAALPDAMDLVLAKLAEGDWAGRAAGRAVGIVAARRGGRRPW